MNYFLNDLEIIWSGKIGLYIDGSVFFPVLNIGFSFVTMQAFKKGTRKIDRLQSAETGFAKMSAPSFENLPESLPTPVALERPISCMIFKTIFSVVRTRKMSTVIAKQE